MSKHTPGPWMVDTNFRGEQFVQAGNTEDGIQPFGSCSCCGEYIYGYNQEEREANARLIAAAPDLLEALKSLLCVDYRSWDNSAQEKWEAASAAVAKAEGEQKS